MKIISILLLLSLSLLQGILGYPLYGVITGSAGGDTRVIVSTVQISDTGTFITQGVNLVYVRQGSFKAISTFDQKNKILYFTTNNQSSFVYGIDVSSTTKKLLPPISLLGCDKVISIKWDKLLNKQLIISGEFGSSKKIFFVPDPTSSFSTPAPIDMTGVSNVVSTFYDWQTEKLWVSFYETGSYRFGWFYFGVIIWNITPVPVTTTLNPDYMWIDSSNGNIIGIGTYPPAPTETDGQSSDNAKKGGQQHILDPTYPFYFYRCATESSCTITGIASGTLTITAATHDPIAKFIYVATVDSSTGANPRVYKIDSSTTGSLSTQFNVPGKLEVLEVSYTIPPATETETETESENVVDGKEDAKPTEKTGGTEENVKTAEKDEL